MKKITSFFLIAALCLACGSVRAQISKYPTADTAAYPYKMTGEELVALLLADTDDTLRIDSTRFTSEVKLPPGARVRRSVILWQCSYEKSADFSESTFSGKANFARSTFSGKANFVGSTFCGDAYFWQCTFSGNADFLESTFSHHADFGKSTFAPHVSFLRSAFLGDADFGRSTFLGYANFRWSVFSGNAFFMQSTFLGDVDFVGCAFYCQDREAVEPVPGKASFARTQWAGALLLSSISTRPGVVLDFYKAKWPQPPMTEYERTKPVLYMEEADYDRLLFPITDEYIPHPLLGFGNSVSASFCTGWRVQVPDPDKTEWPVIQRTYGKFLTFLKESGRYDDYDALFTEFHDLETHYKWYKRDYLSSAFNWSMKQICGYGVNPVQAFWFSLWVVLGSTCIYLIFGKYVRPRYEKGGENAFRPPYFLCRKKSDQRQYDPPRKLQGYRFSLSHLWPKEIQLTRMAWWLIVWRVFVVLRGAWLIFWYVMNFVLFSVNTFCTVGYDNNYPVKGLRYVCMAELVLGYITLTLFLVSLVNILIR